MQYNHTQKVIIYGTLEGQIIIWDFKNKIPIEVLYNCKSKITDLTIDEKVPFFVSGSEDNSVRVWNLKEDGKWFQQNLFYNHTKSVNCVTLLNNYIISGSNDKSLKVIDLQSNFCISTLKEHNAPISYIHLQNNENNIQQKLTSNNLINIASAAENGSICIWDSRTWKIVNTFSEHKSKIFQIQFIFDKIVSASSDNTLKIWNTTSGKCEHTLVGHENDVNCFQYFNNMLISGSKDNTLKIWDFKTGVCLQTMDEHSDWVACLKIFDNKIISGSDDGYIKIWNINLRKCINTLEYNNSTDYKELYNFVTGIEIEENCIISSSWDGCLKFWEFENEDFI